jgi:hypothetical protein
MADDDKSTDETVDSSKVEAEPVTPAPVTPEAAEAPVAAPAVPTMLWGGRSCTLGR